METPSCILTQNCQLRWWRIHLPMYQGEIPMPLAPLYCQAREPKVTKQSPPRVVTPDPSTESPKTKCSSSKGSPHHSLGCSSNNSTPKCQDSTLAKKPSSSKDPTSNSQEKSPKARSSRKHSRSLPWLPSQSDVNGKMFAWKTPAHSTPPFPSAPACLMASAVQWVPTAA